MRQLPEQGEIFLDHVGHFAPDAGAAREGLARAGFLATPFSVQTAPGPDGGKPQPTGTGNVCAMFRAGYVEVLCKTADTPLAQEFDRSLARYGGVHLAAFAVADAAATHARLGASGFRTRPLVYFERPAATEEGEALAAFRVARVERDEFPEGRIQCLTHLTEKSVWQPRWLDHPNGAEALLGIVFRVADPAASAGRFARFLDRPALSEGPGRFVIRLDRGFVRLQPEDAGAGGPAAPFVPCYGIAVASLDRLARSLADGAVPFERKGRVIAAAFPPGLGQGEWWFAERAADLEAACRAAE